MRGSEEKVACKDAVTDVSRRASACLACPELSVSAPCVCLCLSVYISVCP